MQPMKLWEPNWQELKKVAEWWRAFAAPGNSPKATLQP
jgi:hypothetical protein